VPRRQRRPNGPGPAVTVLVIVGALVWLASRTGEEESSPTPDRLASLIAEMDALDAQDVPYCFGGGHITPARPTPPPAHWHCWHTRPTRKVVGSKDAGLDCSSAVSMVLQRVGFDLPTLTSTGFAFWGEPGKGVHVTIWARPGSNDEIGHVYLEVTGKGFWGTSSENHRHGPGWHKWHDFDGFVGRHPPGL
jgi:hypothetical protein